MKTNLRKLSLTLRKSLQLFITVLLSERNLGYSIMTKPNVMFSFVLPGNFKTSFSVLSMITF